MKTMEIDGINDVKLEFLYYPWEYRADSEFAVKPLCKEPTTIIPHVVM